MNIFSLIPFITYSFEEFQMALQVVAIDSLRTNKPNCASRKELYKKVRASIIQEVGEIMQGIHNCAEEKRIEIQDFNMSYEFNIKWKEIEKEEQQAFSKLIQANFKVLKRLEKIIDTVNLPTNEENK